MSGVGIVRAARWLVALLAVAVLAGVAGGGVWWFTHLRGWQSSADVIAVVFGVVAVVITLGVAWAQSWASAGQARGSRAGNGLRSSLRVPVGPIGEIDPTMIGVDRAAQQVLPGGAIPAYVERAIDAELGGALGAAVCGEGPWLVVVSGPSKVGKSRALFEALRGVREGGVSRPLRVLAPIDTEAVCALLASGQSSRRGRAPTVLWLDDLGRMSRR